MQKESLIKKVTPLESVPSEVSQQIQPQAREPLPTLQTYCKSKTFIANVGINPLIAAASALFSIMTKLRYTLSYTDLAQLKRDLIHEVKAFECAALNRNYSEEHIILARYAICASLDDVIMSTAWGNRSDWREDTLLYIFQGEVWGGERLFLLIDKLRENSEQYIEVLEFIYVCLSLGFEGKYRVLDTHKEDYLQLIDSIYRIIKRHRGDSPDQLSKLPIMNLKQQVSSGNTKRLFLGASITVATVMTSLYLLFSFILQEVSIPLNTKLKQISAQKM